MGTRQETLTGHRCHHAGDADLRPNCEGFTVVATDSRVALCGECDAMRSAVGRGQAGRVFPGAALDRLTQATEAVQRAEGALTTP